MVSCSPCLSKIQKLQNTFVYARICAEGLRVFGFRVLRCGPGGLRLGVGVLDSLGRFVYSTEGGARKKP